MGSGQDGRLGLGNFDDRYGPSEIFSLSPTTLIHDNVVEVQAGSFHTLFLTRKDNIFGCGRAKSGALGLDSNRDFLVPIKISVNRRVNR